MVLVQLLAQVLAKFFKSKKNYAKNFQLFSIKNSTFNVIQFLIISFSFKSSLLSNKTSL